MTRRSSEDDRKASSCERRQLRESGPARRLLRARSPAPSPEAEAPRPMRPPYRAHFREPPTSGRPCELGGRGRRRRRRAAAFSGGDPWRRLCVPAAPATCLDSSNLPKRSGSAVLSGPRLEILRFLVPPGTRLRIWPCTMEILVSRLSYVREPGNPVGLRILS